MFESDGTAERLEYDEAEQRAMFEKIAGGRSLIDALGFAPFFHDAELVRLDLQHRASSYLVLKYNPAPALLVGANIFTITFKLDDIFDLALSGSAPAYLNEFRMAWLALSPDSTDDGILVTIKSDTGLTGSIACRQIEISFEVWHQPNP